MPAARTAGTTLTPWALIFRLSADENAKLVMINSVGRAMGED